MGLRCLPGCIKRPFVRSDWSREARLERPCRRRARVRDFSALKASLVHSASALSRRVGALQKAGLVETRKVHKIARNAKADRRSLALRVTSAGVKRIEPVYRRYAELCGRLREDVPTGVRWTILGTNERLMEKAQWGV